MTTRQLKHPADTTGALQKQELPSLLTHLPTEQ